MNIADLLKPVHCNCGMTHTCDIKNVIIKSGAIDEIPNVTADYEHILIVADRNTYGTCGDRVVELIRDKIEKVFVYDTTQILVPDEKSVAEFKSHITEETDLIMGIGSGVIQDLCKYVAMLSGLRYHIVATAPSMDGYASKGAAMIMGNMKITYNARVPEAIIADTEILKDAPMEMIQAGYGDILGKFSCLNDWKLSHVVNDEYFCQYVYDLTYDMLTRTKDLGPMLLARNEDAIRTLMEALVGVGVAMAYAGNSRPASGSEHHLSHFFEVIGIMCNEPYFAHGTDVAYSAVYTQKLREEILLIDVPDEAMPFDRDEWEENIRKHYYDAQDGVIELQDKLGWYNIAYISIYKEKWNAIKEVLCDTPSSAELIEYLRSVGLDINEFEKLYGKEKINTAIFFAKDLKDRYTVLWLYYTLFYKSRN